MEHNEGPRWVYDRCDADHCFCQDHAGDSWRRCCRCGSVQSLENPIRIWDSRSAEDSLDTGYDYFSAFLAQLRALEVA